MLPDTLRSHSCCPNQRDHRSMPASPAYPPPVPSPRPGPRLVCRCPAVVPVLMQGMMELNRKRPADPIDFLCSYLQQHNPRKPKTN